MELTESGKLGLIIAALKKQKGARVQVEGKSMMPELTPGTKVKILKRPFKEIKSFDWVAFQRNGHLTIHQVVFKSKKYLISWGVNNRFTDGRVKEKEILGVIEKPERWRRWNLWYLVEAKVILAEFKRAGIKNFILKGAPWQKARHGFLVDKFSADLDWLIEREKFPQAKKILLKRGYRMKNGPVINEVSFVKRVGEKKLIVDLHLLAIRTPLRAWYKKPIERKKMERLTDYFLAKRVLVRGWPVLPEVENLFYLCLNLIFHHAGRGIYQLAQIAFLIERGKIDWQRFERLADEFRMKSYIYFPLLWAQRFFKVKVERLEKFKPPKIKSWLAKLVINHWTVLKPLAVDAWWPSKWNLALITYLRLVLSLGQ